MTKLGPEQIQLLAWISFVIGSKMGDKSITQVHGIAQMREINHISKKGYYNDSERKFLKNIRLEYKDELKEFYP